MTKVKQKKPWNFPVIMGIFVVVLCLFAGLIWSVPFLMSTASGKKQVEKILGTKLHGKVQIDNLEAGWTSGVLVEGFSLTDGQGKQVLGFKKLVSDVQIMELLSKRPNIGYTELVEPRLYFHGKQKGQSNLEKALGMDFSQVEAESKSPSKSWQDKLELPFEGVIEVSNGLVELSLPDQEPVTLGKIQLDLEADESLKLDLSAESQQGELRGEIELNASFVGTEISLFGKLSQFPTIMLQPYLQAYFDSCGLALIQTLGHKLNAEVKGNIKENTAIFQFSAKSPTLQSNLEMSLADGKLQLKSPAKTTVRILPGSLKDCQQSDWQLQEASTINISLNELSVPLGEGAIAFSLQSTVKPIKAKKGNKQAVDLLGLQISVASKNVDDYLGLSFRGNGSLFTVPLGFSGQSFFQIQDGLQLRPDLGASRLGVSLNAGSFSKLRDLQAHYAEKEPLGTEDVQLKGNLGLILTLNELNLQGNEKTNLSFSLTQDGAISLVGSEAKKKADLSDLSIQGRFQQADSQLKLTGSLALNQEPQNLSLELGNFLNSSNEFDKSSAQAALTIQAKNLPVYVSSRLLSFREATPLGMEGLLGDRATVSIALEVDQMRGPVSLDVNSGNLKTRARGEIDGRRLTLSEDLSMKLALNKKIGEGFLADINPLLASIESSSEPASFDVSKDGFRVDLFPLDLSTLSLNRGALDLGKATMENTGELRQLLSFLKASRLRSAKEIPAWFTPLYFSIQEGHLKAKRMDMLLGLSLQVATWGEVNLVSGSLNLVLGIPASTLSHSFGIKGLSGDNMFTIAMEGTGENPKVDWASAAKQIPALAAQRITGNALLGNLVGAASSALLGGQAVPPPSTQPFPWTAEGLPETMERDGPLPDIIPKLPTKKLIDTLKKL